MLLTTSGHSHVLNNVTSFATTIITPLMTNDAIILGWPCHHVLCDGYLPYVIAPIFVIQAPLTPFSRLLIDARP